MKKLMIGLCIVFTTTAAFAGDCTKDQAKKSVEWACKQFAEKSEADAIAAIKDYKYCGQNYVWLQDTPDINMVMHPIKRKLNGKNLKGYKDKKGKAIFIEFDKEALKSADGGWVDYVWPKPNEEDATPKISFVKKCNAKIIAGSGVWTN